MRLKGNLRDKEDKGERGRWRRDTREGTLENELRKRRRNIF